MGAPANAVAGVLVAEVAPSHRENDAGDEVQAGEYARDHGRRDPV